MHKIHGTKYFLSAMSNGRKRILFSRLKSFLDNVPAQLIIWVRYPKEMVALMLWCNSKMRGGRRRYVFPSDFYHPLIRDFLSHL